MNQLFFTRWDPLIRTLVFGVLAVRGLGRCVVLETDGTLSIIAKSDGSKTIDKSIE